jgi:high-affinity iron transporter
MRGKNMLRKWSICLFLMGMLLFPVNTWAQEQWQGVITEIKGNLQNAVQMYQLGKINEAKDLVNEAYFGPFESQRMEQAIRSQISAKRAAEIEYEFTLLKKSMEKRADLSTVQSKADGLVSMLNNDAKTLQGNSEQEKDVWYYSFLILLGLILLVSVKYRRLKKKTNASTNFMEKRSR